MRQPAAPQKLIDLYRKGDITEGALYAVLVEWIPEKSIEELLSFLDDRQKREFVDDLEAISKPDWISLSGWRPSEEAIKEIRKYLVRIGRVQAF
jgi:hypothetical protein